MSKFEVTKELVVTVSVKIIVDDVEGKEDAIDMADSVVPGSAHDAMTSKNGGWKALVSLQPPKGVKLAQAEGLKAVSIVGASGGEKVRKL